MSGTDVIVYGGKAGRYTITLTVADPAGGSAEQVVAVRVTALPGPGTSDLLRAAWPLLLLVALVGAEVAAVAMAGMVAQARGIDSSQWWTSAGIGENLLGFLRLLAASLVWGLFGFALGTTFRSGGAAIGIGLGALLIGGHIAARFWADADKWMPDSLLSVFATGGTTSVSLSYAGLVVASYAVTLGAVSGLSFSRGDVPG